MLPNFPARYPYHKKVPHVGCLAGQYLRQANLWMANFATVALGNFLTTLRVCF